eukprot:GILJ01000485.1.p1 GENE.GILJ01000485.1~~GILJ01000485.1.p1  ORF type:complete len:259 (-),score=42.04 GILJ01000485.1:178-906(-)
MSSVLRGLLCVVLLGAAAAKVEFEIERLHLVDSDSTSGNFFFRGNIPKINGVFIYDQLVASMRQVAKTEANVDLPADFRIVDISFLNELPLIGDTDDIHLEDNYFAEHGDHGEFLRMPLFGLPTNPNSLPGSLRTTLLRSVWAVDRLPEKMRHFKSMLAQKTAKPTVFYVHCEYGCDRTGEFSGAYAIQYLNKSIDDAWTTNVQKCGRAPNFLSRNALEWYCFYLKEVNGMSIPSCKISAGL